MERRNTLLACCTAALATACAAPPAAHNANVAAAPPTCAQVASSRALAEEERTAALDERAHAWKAVVPLVAAAKLAHATADLAATDARIAILDDKARRMGCAASAG